MTTDDDSTWRRKTDRIGEPGHDTLRILAVDDDDSYLRYLGYVLTKAGFEVDFAHDGAAAIDRIHFGSRIDMMIVDLAMPGIDGIETVRRINAESRFPGLYTILLTSKDGAETKLRALDSGLDEYLTKASSEQEIMARIRSAARRLQMERRLHVENEELQMLALTDELTHIANRRALFRAAEEMLRTGRPLTVVMFDLERFKYVNDTYGHLTGDRILADVAAAFKVRTRYCDVIGRYGGDEFLLLLPDTDVEEARHIADRLLDGIRELSWTIGDVVLTVNAQTGIASSTMTGSDLEELLRVCDAALYRGKKVRTTPTAEERPELR